MRFNTTIAIHREDDWYIAKCLYSSVASHGKTLEEAMTNVREALELFYEDGDTAPVTYNPFVTTLEFAV